MKNDSNNSITNVDEDVLAPLILDRADEITWDDSADVVVIGYGGAGVVTALQAKERNIDVLAIDRFDGGGATALSGGVYYGGGTRFQREAGFDDSAEEMLKYLWMEAKGVVAYETMRRFCLNNNRDLEWLEAHGVKFGGALTTEKTAYPADGKFLYYSGNERIERYARAAKPAPRGHRTIGTGFSGYAFYNALRESADKAGIRVLTHAPVSRLVATKNGAIVGVQVAALPDAARDKHIALFKKISPFVPFKGEKSEEAIRNARVLERICARPKLVRARNGVVLCTGGFAYNLRMLAKYRPLLAQNYTALMRLGSMGCDGSGIELGQSVGGAVALMDSAFVAKALAPPSALLYGIVVNARGQRFVNEDAYAGFLGDAIAAQPGGRAWLIMSGTALRKAIMGSMPGGNRQFARYGLPILLNLALGGTRRGRSPEALARKCGIDPAALKETIDVYGATAEKGAPDPLEKSADYVEPLGKGSYTAMDISIGNKFAFTALFTLGGLVVDENNGAVKRADGAPIEGLYAAGRAAVGLCSSGYISGMSIADCVFSGRRAGEAAARRGR
ncbi:MAG TPA: FAD-binding protein [Steroidobacteraceae bacterium]